MRSPVMVLCTSGKARQASRQETKKQNPKVGNLGFDKSTTRRSLRCYEIGDPVGSRFFCSFVFEMINLSVSSEVCFLAAWDKRMTPGSVFGCIENAIDTVVFDRFHFFRIG